MMSADDKLARICIGYVALIEGIDSLLIGTESFRGVAWLSVEIILTALRLGEIIESFCKRADDSEAVDVSLSVCKYEDKYPLCEP